jgi:hypothetical protein
MTIEEVLIDAIVNNNTCKLIGKSLIYRLPNRPFSIKIDRVEILPGGVVRGVKLHSSEGFFVNLRVNMQSSEITSLSFDRLVQTELENFINAGRFQIPFQIETKIPIPGIENPFKTGIEYQIKTEKGKEGVYGFRKDYVNYIFTSKKSSKDSVTFHVVDSGNEITLERKVRGEKKSIIRQDISWETYQTLFLVLTRELETYSSVESGENNLDSRLVSLSKKPLATEGMVKKALKEKDICRMELLNELIENYNNRDGNIVKAFDFINKNPSNFLPEELFNEIFGKKSLFHRLCGNQYVKAHYKKEEGDLMTLSLKNKFALDILHEAQVCIFTHVKPKDQQGNQDLIRQLCEATRLTKPMQNAFAIPFIGPTGSGKSTAVSYMMGIPMAQFEDDFGEKRIKHKESADGGIPKIGFALGLSETIHASSFELLPPPPFKKDPKNIFAVAPRHDPKFKNGLTKNNLRLADFPGFFDTRGTHYEIITNFSIDRAMEAFEGVPALVQVIPYENITADRAGVLYSTLKDLETKFPSLLTNKELQKRFHFVVTKFNEIGLEQIQARLEQLVNEYRSDGLSGEKYFSFLLHQLLTKNVHLLNPLSATARLQILDSIIEKFNPQHIDPIKTDYQGGFKEAKMQLRIGDVLHGAIICWNNLLKGFLEQKENLSQLANTLEEITEKLQKYLKNENEKADNLELLENKRGKPFDPEDPVIKQMFSKIENDSKKTREKYRTDIDTLGSEIKSLDSEVTRNLNAIDTITSEITELATGSIEDPLYNRVVTQGFEQKFSGTWASHVDVEAKIRRQLDNGADALSDHEGEVEGQPHTSVAGRDSWNCSKSVVLHKQYELVPNDLNETEKLRKLNELAGGVGFRSVILEDGSGWRIDVDSSGDLKFIDIKVHDSGKKFMYGYTEKCNTSPPYPKLIIKAVLPKTVYNGKLIQEKRTQLENLTNRNVELRQKIATKNGVKEEYENQLKKLENEFKDNVRVGLEKAISEAKAQLEVSKELIATTKRELEAVKIEQKQAQWKQRKYAVSISYNKEIMEGTYTCSQSFRPVENDKLGGMVQQKSVEVLGKCQEFVRLYRSHIDEVKSDAQEILRQSQVFDFEEEAKEAEAKSSFTLESMRSEPTFLKTIPLAINGTQQIVNELRTVGDGDCLIHALYGIDNGSGQIACRDAAERRKKISELIYNYDKRSETGTLRLSSFVQSGVEVSNQNLVNLATTMARTDGSVNSYLGLEHVQLIARLMGLNILVYNNATQETVELFYNKDSQEIRHIISYNGNNHWNQCV